MNISPESKGKASLILAAALERISLYPFPLPNKLRTLALASNQLYTVQFLVRNSHNTVQY
jgi:hypothetical protein